MLRLCLVVLDGGEGGCGVHLDCSVGVVTAAVALEVVSVVLLAGAGGAVGWAVAASVRHLRDCV